MTNWDKLTKENRATKLDWRRVSAFELPKNIFDDLKKWCFKAKEIGVSNSKNLAGHIKEEYTIKKPVDGGSEREYFINNHTKQFENYMIDCIHQGPVSETWSNIALNTNDRPIVLESLWVNFSKKYEFNPPHSHSGFISFVIFVNIPYDLNKEEECFSHFGNNKEKNYTSKFTFLNVNYNGRIVSDTINVDKSFEGKMLMFDAKQSHQVFPFYTSDDYRITVSGNFRFDT